MTRWAINGLSHWSVAIMHVRQEIHAHAYICYMFRSQDIGHKGLLPECSVGCHESTTAGKRIRSGSYCPRAEKGKENIIIGFHKFIESANPKPPIILLDYFW